MHLPFKRALTLYYPSVMHQCGQIYPQPAQRHFYQHDNYEFVTLVDGSPGTLLGKVRFMGKWKVRTVHWVSHTNANANQCSLPSWSIHAGADYTGMDPRHFFHFQ